MSDGITFHHVSLAAYEAHKACQDRLIAEYEANHRPSFRLHTADWVQDAENSEELKQLIDDAVLCNLDWTLEILPF